MKHLKSYKEVNEELTYNQRIWLNSLTLLGSFIGDKLLGIYPLLNFRWKEIKRRTIDSKYPTIITHSSTPEKMEHDLIKITKKDLPSNRMSVGMFLRDWNIYLAKDYKSTGGGGVPRPVVYITKDEIEKGDIYHGERITDRDIYNDASFEYIDGMAHTKIKKDTPIIIMIAKFDNIDKIKDMQQNIDDICLELEDDLPVDVEPHFDKHGDYLWIDVKIKKDSSQENRYITFNDELDSKLKEVGERIVAYLKIEKYKGFEFKVKYKVKAPFHYKGSKGRFTDIIKKSTEWTEKYDMDSDYPLMDIDNNILNVSRLGDQYSDEYFELTGDDIKTLLSDLDNCVSGSIHDITSPKPSVIELRSISIIFRKKS